MATSDLPPAHGQGDRDGGSRRRADNPNGDLVAQLTRWLAEQRVDEAARARSRERWLVQQVEEEGSFAGVLLDLAERDQPVLLQSVSGRRRRGRIRAVAGDFLALQTDAGVDVLLGYSGIASVRTQDRSRGVAGERAVDLDTTFAEALGGLAGQRPRVLVVTFDGEATAGELRAVGHDVMTLRLDGDGRPNVYLRVASVAEVSLAG